MKTLLIVAVFLLPFLAQAETSTNAYGLVNTNTFVLRPGRPATTNEVATGTNLSAWLTPANASWLRPQIFNTSSNVGYTIFGPSNNWSEIHQRTIIPDTTTGALFVITLPKAYTNYIRHIQITQFRHGDSSAGQPIVTMNPISYTSNSVTIRVYVNTTFAGGDSVGGWLRVEGQ